MNSYEKLLIWIFALNTMKQNQQIYNIREHFFSIILENSMLLFMMVRYSTTW